MNKDQVKKLLEQTHKHLEVVEVHTAEEGDDVAEADAPDVHQNRPSLSGWKKLAPSKETDSTSEEPPSMADRKARFRQKPLTGASIPRTPTGEGITLARVRAPGQTRTQDMLFAPDGLIGVSDHVEKPNRKKDK